MSGSEIARFREQYELEYQAARRGLEGVAMVGSHQFITKRMENMWEQFQQLVQVVGKRKHTGSPLESPLSQRRKDKFMHPFEEYLQRHNLEAITVSMKAQVRYLTVWKR